jgi:hypothetical protein
MGLPTPANQVGSGAAVDAPLVGVDLHELAPTPGIAVGCIVAEHSCNTGSFSRGS